MEDIIIHTPAPETESTEPTADEVMAQCVAIESEKRKWLRGLTQFVATRAAEQDSDEMVKTAARQAYTAALDRIARLARSDEPIE